jgi:hypothetical protein
VSPSPYGLGTVSGMDATTTRYRFPSDEEMASVRSVVLVEGESDRLALEALGERLGHDFASHGVVVLPMAGSKNIRRFLDRYGPQGLDLRLAGLCDAAEEGDFRRGLESVGFGSGLTRNEMEGLGWFVCDADLEDELIRALGAESILKVIEDMGELGMFRTFRKQPEWRDRAVEDQLRRFIGAGSGRKIRIARPLIEALDLTRIPLPLEGVLLRVTAPG